MCRKDIVLEVHWFESTQKISWPAKKSFIFALFQLLIILFCSTSSEDSKTVLRFDLGRREVGEKIDRTFGPDKQTDKHRSLLYRCHH